MIESKVREGLQHLAAQAKPAELAEPAVRQGRRIRLRRSAGTGVAALIAVALVVTGGYAGVRHLRETPTSSSAAGATTTATATPSVAPSGGVSGPKSRPVANCSMSVLPEPRGGVAGVSYVRVDPTGTYVSWGNVIWTGGTGHVVGLNGTDEVHGINAKGVAVGFDGVRAWLDRDGHKQYLASVPGKTNSVAEGINTDGDIVGQAFSPGGNTVAVLWPAAHPGTVQVLTALGSAGAIALGIGDDGTIVGDLGDGDAPYVWDANGTGHVLAIPAGYHGGKAFGIAGDWATGWVGTSVSDTNLVAARWNLATGAVTVYPDLIDNPLSVTTSGDILTVGSEAASVLVKDGTEYTLPVPSANDFGEGDTMSADGSTIVGILHAGEPTGPVVWHC